MNIKKGLQKMLKLVLYYSYDERAKDQTNDYHTFKSKPILCILVVSCRSSNENKIYLFLTCN